MRTFFRLGTVENPLDCCRDDFRDLYFGFDGDFSRCDFGVTRVARKLAALGDAREAAASWRIISENIQRVFAGMKPTFARGDIAIMLVGLTDFELKAATLEILVKTLEVNDLLASGFQKLGFAAVGMVYYSSILPIAGVHDIGFLAALESGPLTAKPEGGDGVNNRSHFRGRSRRTG